MRTSPPSPRSDPRQQQALGLVRDALSDTELEPEAVRSLIRRLFKDGAIDKVMMLSALHVLAASPRVKDWAEAARLVGEQEFAALELGGPNLQANLASVDRHRGVLAFLRGHHEVALDYFTRALERERSSENLGNVLCALLALGEEDEARALLLQVRRSLPTPLVEELDDRVRRDPDLALLRGT